MTEISVDCLKRSIFSKADYFARNWALEGNTSIGQEYQIKFCGILELMEEAGIEKEYPEFEN